MQEILNAIDDIITSSKLQDVINGVSIYPINQDGRQVSCFCDINFNNAELYDYNILKKGGNYLLINCWHSLLYCHPHQPLRKSHPSQNAIYDCKKCDFCLFDSAGYNMFFDLSLDIEDAEFNKLLDRIEEKLNAPICDITLKIADNQTTKHRGNPIYERRERPCITPMSTRGIIKRSQKAKFEKTRVRKKKTK